MSHDHPHSAGNVRCQNCDTELKGPFCHHCGQHDFDFHRSFGHVAMEALESFFHFDGKIFRDTWTLLRHPGRLTREFNAGKRASQVPPLRFYIFVSLIFFVWFSHTSHDIAADVLDDGTPAAPANRSEEKAPAPAHAEKPLASHDATKPTSGEDVSPAPAAANDSRVKSVEESELPETMKAKLVHAIEEPAETREKFLHMVPKMLLVCLPLFALATRVLFRKSGLNYLQHVVASLHLHTFVFIFWMLSAAVAYLVSLVSTDVSATLDVVAFFYLVGYLFVSLRTLFGGSWKRIAVKACLLATGYSLTLALGFAAVGALIVWL